MCLPWFSEVYVHSLLSPRNSSHTYQHIFMSPRDLYHKGKQPEIFPLIEIPKTMLLEEGLTPLCPFQELGV